VYITGKNGLLSIYCDQVLHSHFLAPLIHQYNLVSGIGHSLAPLQFYGNIQKTLMGVFFTEHFIHLLNTGGSICLSIIHRKKYTPDEKDKKVSTKCQNKSSDKPRNL